MMQENQTSQCTGYEPTRKDIRRVRKEIQATWSPRERAERRRAPHVAWSIRPTIRLSTPVESPTA